MIFKIGDKVEVLPYIESEYDPPQRLIGNIGKVTYLGRGEEFGTGVTFDDHDTEWYFRKEQLKLIETI